MLIELSQEEVDMIESILWVKKSRKEYTGDAQAKLKTLHEKFNGLSTKLPAVMAMATEKEWNDFQKAHEQRQRDKYIEDNAKSYVANYEHRTGSIPELDI